MAYLADPGGIFESDTHRRTLAHLPLPGDKGTTLVDLYERMRPDVGTDFEDEGELADVVADLEASGYAAGWKQTKKGLDALNAPVPESE
jgi:hypothetical protein